MLFNQVKIFITVAQMNSFSRAAEELFISQPTVTSNIKKLEDHLGVILLDRNSKNISLTEAGALFYRYALELINLYKKAEYSLTGYKKDMEGELELYSSTIPGQYLLPYMVKEFKEQYPLIRFTIKHQASELILERILSGLVNIGFVGAKKCNDSVAYADLYEDRLVLIVPPEKKFPVNPVHIMDLAGEDIILREEGSGTRLLFERALKENHLNMTIFASQIVNEDLEAIKTMVTLGVGISLVPFIAVKDKIASRRLDYYEIDDLNLKRFYSLAYCKNRTLSPIEERFRTFIIERNWTVPSQS